MGYLDQCTACDRGEHNRCDGTFTLMDQDGPQRLVCQCIHRSKILEASRVAEAEARVRRLMRELRIDRSHVLTLRDSEPPRDDDRDAPNSVVSGSYARGGSGDAKDAAT